MTENSADRAVLLDTLACDIAARPAGAPSLEELRPAIRVRRRGADALEITFAPEARETVAAAIAAERLCCAEIGWDLALEPAVRLRISATPAQLDLLEMLFAG